MPERQQRIRLAGHSLGVNFALLGLIVVVAIGIAVFAPRSFTDWLVGVGPFWGAIVFALPFFFISRILAKSTATKCPKCGEETLEAEPGRNTPIRHHCSTCNTVFIDGVEKEPTQNHDQLDA